MATTYTLPATLAEGTKLSTKLNGQIHKLSTVLAIHELSMYTGWQAGIYADELAPSAAGKDFAPMIARSAGHVSKLRGILTADHAITKPFIDGLATATDRDSIVAVITEMVGEIDKAARKDETSKHYGKGANTVDAIYSYLGIGTSGGNVTWEGTGLSSAKKATKANVTKAQWLKRMAEIADEVWSA